MTDCRARKTRATGTAGESRKVLFVSIASCFTDLFIARVDLNRFPALAEVEYHLANLTSGDCLLVPSGWIFQERALENSIAVIYNIKHHMASTISPKELETCAEYDPTFTLDQIDWSTEQAPMNFK